MHIEVQVALNFVISYLYNKLPRRRVNLFGEELEKALKQKFDGHWYPEKPFKGSAFRCLRASLPIDPVIEQAARESGVEVSDIRENLPEELCVWIDPGEVSYRIGEKGAVKMLYTEADSSDESACSSSSPDSSSDASRPFNPEAQCFKPIESLGASLGRLALSTSASTANGIPASASPSAANANHSAAAPAFAANGNSSSSNSNGCSPDAGGSGGEATAPASPNGFSKSGGGGGAGGGGGGGSNLIQAFIPKATAPVTFTTASFAQTKFGSTKLKSSGKRSHRLSPTEFSNYIKQRALQQQLQGSPNVPPTASGAPSPRFRGSSPRPQQQRPRSLSPKLGPHQPALDPFLMMAAVAPPCGPRGFFDGYLADLSGQAAPLGFPEGQFLGAAAAAASGVGDNPKSFLDGMTLNSLPYSARYQHLLVAN